MQIENGESIKVELRLRYRSTIDRRRGAIIRTMLNDREHPYTNGRESHHADSAGRTASYRPSCGNRADHLG